MQLHPKTTRDEFREIYQALDADTLKVKQVHLFYVLSLQLKLA